MKLTSSGDGLGGGFIICSNCAQVEFYQRVFRGRKTTNKKIQGD